MPGKTLPPRAAEPAQVLVAAPAADPAAPTAKTKCRTPFTRCLVLSQASWTNAEKTACQARWGWELGAARFRSAALWYVRLRQERPLCLARLSHCCLAAEPSSTCGTASGSSYNPGAEAEAKAAAMTCGDRQVFWGIPREPGSSSSQANPHPISAPRLAAEMPRTAADRGLKPLTRQNCPLCMQQPASTPWRGACPAVTPTRCSKGLVLITRQSSAVYPASETAGSQLNPP